MPKDLYEAALEYADMGLRVIPIRPNGKEPAVKVREFKNRAPTKRELHDWFNNGVPYNIAALMEPSGLVLVDVDTYKDPASLEEFLASHNTGMRVRTPRGGMHLYYKAIEGDDYRDTQSKEDIGLGIDTKYKGYGLLPPSVINGKPYTWEQHDAPAPLPAKIRKALLVNPSVDGQPVQSQPEAFDIWKKVLQNGFDEGKHNEQLLAISKLMARVMASGNEGLQKQFMLQTAMALDALDDTPQGEHVIPTLKSAWDYEAKRLYAAVSAPAAVPLEDQKLSVVTLSDMYSEYHDYQLSYIVDQWVPEQSILYMSAPPETYKTWLLLDMAVSLALGDVAEPFMGQFKVPAVRTPVLVFQQEDFPGQVLMRVSTIIRHKTKGVAWDLKEVERGIWSMDTPMSAPIYFHNNAQLSFDDPESIALLEQRIVETGARLVLIDPLYALADSSDYFAKVARQMQDIKRLRTKYGVTFVFAHHNRKSGGVGREQAYGSVLLNGAFEGAIILEKSEDGTIKATRSGKFFPGSATWYLKFDIDTDEGRYHVLVDENEPDGSGPNDSAILTYIRNVGPSRGAEVAEEFGLNRGTVSRILKRLAENGKLVYVGKKYAIATDTGGA